MLSDIIFNLKQSLRGTVVMRAAATTFTTTMLDRAAIAPRPALVGRLFARIVAAQERRGAPVQQGTSATTAMMTS